MAALGVTAANDLANQLLTFYVKKGPLSQTTQDKPLLREFMKASETFPGGKDNISLPVQGAYMEDTNGFYSGYSNDDSLSFLNGDDVLRIEYPWKEMAANFWITHTELKKDGITILDGQKQREHKSVEAVRITTSVLKNRLTNFGESLARARQKMFWRDGTQDAKVIPGLLSILTDTPNVGTTGGLNRATYTWWRHRARLGALAETTNTGPAITHSKTEQTLTKTLRAEARQLFRFGGKPTLLLAGSDFIEALEDEVHEKGIYTQEGFKNEGKTDIGMAKIHMRGLGTFEYDPSLDDLGLSKRCYVIDPRHLMVKTMEGEWNKLLTPERPYNYLVFLKTVTDTGALICDQLNCHGVYEVA